MDWKEIKYYFVLGFLFLNIGWLGMMLMWKKGFRILLIFKICLLIWLFLGFYIGCFISIFVRWGYEINMIRVFIYCWNGFNGDIFIIMFCKFLYKCLKVFLKFFGLFLNFIRRFLKNLGGNGFMLLLVV